MAANASSTLEPDTELGYSPEFLDSIKLSSLKSENILLRSFAAHVYTDPPDGFLPHFLLWHLTTNVRECSKFMISHGGQQGIIRYMRDGHFPVEPEETFAQWRTLLAMNIPVFDYWSFICCYVTDEGVENMVRRTWLWKGDIGDQMYASIRDFVCKLYKSLMQCPVDHSNGFTMLLSYYAIMYKALACFDRKTIIKNGSLKPVAIPLSRNACRERVRDKREKEFQRAEAEATAQPPQPQPPPVLPTQGDPSEDSEMMENEQDSENED
jgi:hypothetical protein